MSSARRWLTCLLAAAVVVSPLLSPPQPAHAATDYWVSPLGDDAATGTAPDAAWRTLIFAFKQLRPGDTLWVQGSAATPYVENVGDYRYAYATDLTRRVSYAPATAQAPIRVVAAPGHRPWLVGLLWVRGADYWTFDGLNVRWRNTKTFNRQNHDSMLVKFMDGVGWEFRNAEVRDARGYAGVYVGNGPRPGPAGWRLRRNCIHHTHGSWTHSYGQDHNVYIATGLGNRGGLIENNIIFAARRGFNIKVGVGSDRRNGSEHLTIRFNTLHRAVSNILVGFRSNNVAIRRNLAGRVGKLATGRKHHANEPNLRGYNVTGRRNAASYNYGFLGRKLIRNSLGGDWSIRHGIRDHGGNRVGVNPRFNNITSCRNGFWPRNRRLPFGARYGRAR